MLEIVGLFSLGIILILIHQNRQRAKPLREVSLTANCLMTRHPLLFVAGKKSLFYFLSYWNHLPQILAEHGYEVYNLNLPWKNTNLRMKKLLDFLQSHSQKQSFHLIVDPSTAQELELLLTQTQLPGVQSITLMTHEAQNRNSLKPLVTPIEELILEPTHKDSILWKAHQTWSGIKSFPQFIVGWTNPQQLSLIRKHLLKRIIFLAERDHSKDLHHDRHQKNLLRH